MSILFFFFLLQTAAVFGDEFCLSAGAGGVLGGFFTRSHLSAEGTVPMDASQEMDQVNYGFFAFLDVTYCEFSMLYQKGANTYKQTANVPLLDNFADSSGDGWETVLGLCLLGKYPFRVSEKLTLFPLLGAEYQICRKQRRRQDDGWVYDRDDGLREKGKDGKAFRLSDWNVFWIHIGGGMDFMLSGNIFIRCSLLYSIRTMTGYERKNLDLVKEQTKDDNPSTGGLTSGPSLRLSLGYRFYTL
jgi:hypothetical protein